MLERAPYLDIEALKLLKHLLLRDQALLRIHGHKHELLRWLALHCRLLGRQELLLLLRKALLQ